SGKFQIHLQSGRTFEADSVVQALGNQTPANIPGTNEILNHPLYISNPWTANPITSSNSRILILGTGLTMIDTVLSLEAQNHNVSVLAVSRHGLLPSAHFNTQKPEKIPEFKNGDLKVLVQSVREGIKQLESQGGDWRWMIDSLRPALQNLWKSLSHGDKKQFLRHVRPYWEVCRHRIAPEIAEKIHGHIGAGRLEVRAARIVKIEVLKTKFLGTFKIRGSSQIEQRVFDCVINCAGPQTDFTQVRSQLVENLLKRKMIAVDSLKLGICADERNQVLDSKGDSQNGFFAIGSMLKGMLWETTAVPELRVQAEKLSKEICSFVFQERESPGEVAL
ncbi:MAG: FAD/NAD(P)-binding protein, partial [Pseudobdellovibrionaceae bacterium]